MKKKATNCIKLLWTSKYSMLEKNKVYGKIKYTRLGMKEQWIIRENFGELYICASYHIIIFNH